MDESKNKKALSLAIKYLTYRQRSEAELIAYLDRKGIEKNAVNNVLSELKRYGYIDDFKYAHDYIKFQQHKGHGVRRIRYDLQQKNIDGSIIDEKINESFNPEDELERAKRLIANRKLKPDEANEKWLIRQAAYLQRRGFENNIIYKVLKDYNTSE